MKIHTNDGEIIRNLELYSNIAGLKINKITFTALELQALARLSPRMLFEFFKNINQRVFIEKL